MHLLAATRLSASCCTHNNAQKPTAVVACSMWRVQHQLSACNYYCTTNCCISSSYVQRGRATLYMFDVLCSTRLCSRVAPVNKLSINRSRTLIASVGTRVAPPRLSPRGLRTRQHRYEFFHVCAPSWDPGTQRGVRGQQPIEEQERHYEVNNLYVDCLYREGTLRCRSQDGTRKEGKNMTRLGHARKLLLTSCTTSQQSDIAHSRRISVCTR